MSFHRIFFYKIEFDLFCQHNYYKKKRSREPERFMIYYFLSASLLQVSRIYTTITPKMPAASEKMNFVLSSWKNPERQSIA